MSICEKETYKYTPPLLHHPTCEVSWTWTQKTEDEKWWSKAKSKQIPYRPPPDPAYWLDFEQPPTPYFNVYVSVCIILAIPEPENIKTRTHLPCLTPPSNTEKHVVDPTHLPTGQTSTQECSQRYQQSHLTSVVFSFSRACRLPVWFNLCVQHQFELYAVDSSNTAAVHHPSVSIQSICACYKLWTQRTKWAEAQHPNFEFTAIVIIIKSHHHRASSSSKSSSFPSCQHTSYVHTRCIYIYIYVCYMQLRHTSTSTKSPLGEYIVPRHHLHLFSHLVILWRLFLVFLQSHLEVDLSVDCLVTVHSGCDSQNTAQSSRAHSMYI